MARPKKLNTEKATIYIDKDLLEEIIELTGITSKTELVRLSFTKYIEIIKKKKVVDSFGTMKLKD